MSRIAILCPGRGSYAKKTRNSLDPSHPFVARAEALRAEYGLDSLLDLDGGAWNITRQLRPDNVSPLIWLVSMIHAEAAMKEHQAVGIAGNSMGWYTALAIAGALDFEDGFRLVQEMALLQMEHPAGGQVLFPIVDEDWRPSPQRIEEVRDALTDPDVYESIRLGGYVVLAASEAGLAVLKSKLPDVLMGTVSYPIKLAQHGPYHTPLLDEVAQRARAQLTRLAWRRPVVTLIDGRGRRYSPWSTDPSDLMEYTLGAQVTSTYDFTRSVRVALREFAPELLCLPGPGNTLGSICAQIAIAEGWRGLTNREEFANLQESSRPLVWSMRR
ncbi:MAG: ACP S-malonyltransferase [Planctomycetota bacterium]|jgi:malonyl CoA-acyl carrier protein transacylase